MTVRTVQAAAASGVQDSSAQTAAGAPVAGAGSDGLSTYFSYLRRDVLNQVPSNARNVLSVGCGSGVTEAELVRRGVRVTAIELNPAAAAAARERGIEVLEGDATSAALPLSRRTFDCLIYADVLEHIAEPRDILRSHVQQLLPGGTVIISIPNFRNYRVFWQLFVRGHVRYEDAGIFDRTHLRITTRAMVYEWFREVGVVPTFTSYKRAGRKGQLLWRWMPSLAKEYIAAQVVVAGVKKP